MTDVFRISIADVIYESARRQLDRRTEECWELLDEVRALDEENRVLRYNLATERSRYTLGGVPPGYRPWGNVKLPPPPSAESGRFDGS